jgi:hypothetical protein
MPKRWMKRPSEKQRRRAEAGNLMAPLKQPSLSLILVVRIITLQLLPLPSLTAREVGAATGSA